MKITAGRLLLRASAVSLVVAFIVAALLIGGLWRGIDIDRFSVGPLVAEQLSLRLDGKLQLLVENLQVADQSSGGEKQAGLDVDQARLARKVLWAVRWTERLFSSIVISHLDIAGLQGSFGFNEDGIGSLILSDQRDQRTQIDLGFRRDEQLLLFDLRQLSMGDSGILADGTLRLNLPELVLDGVLQVQVAATLPIYLAFRADRRQLDFRGKGLQEVPSISPVVALFNLPRTIEVWLIDYLQAEDFALQSVSGTLPYDDPTRLLQTLQATAKVTDVAYTFAPALPPVSAPEVAVRFARGRLHILPDQPTYEGIAGDGSEVEIDFNEGALLTVGIVGQAQVAESVAAIMENYRLPFPLAQRRGVTDIDLDLVIDLPTLTITADGRFLAKESEFDIGGGLFTVPLLDVRLNTTRLSFDHLELRRPGKFAAQLSGELDFGRKRADIEIIPLDFTAVSDAVGLQLAMEEGQQLSLRYRAAEQEQSVDVPATTWRYRQKLITLEAFRMPFDAASLSGSIPPVELAIGRELRARVNGEFGSQQPYLDLDIMLLQLRGENLQLGKRRSEINIQLADKLQIVSARDLDLVVKGLPVTLRPSRFSYAGRRLHVHEGGLQIGDGMRMGLAGELDITSGSGQLRLLHFLWQDQYGSTLLDGGEQLLIKLARQGASTRLSSEQLGLRVDLSPDGAWWLRATDFQRLSARSPVLAHFHLDSGSMDLRSPADSTRYDFNGRVYYPYAIMVEGDSPVHDYTFKGWSDGRKVSLMFNDRVEIELGKNIFVRSDGVGYNMRALLDLFEGREGGEDEGQTIADSGGVAETRLRFIARDSFAWLGKDHRVPADHLVIHHTPEHTKMDLQHRAGFASLEVTDDELFLVGTRFSDEFARGLLAKVADIDGGSLAFRAQGKRGEINAVARMTDTVIKDYKQLNNMLALINTVPGLMTFNPPNYSEYGLPVTELYAGIVARKGEITLESLLIDSPELTIRGEGVMNFAGNTTDMTFNLVLGAKKSIARIPLLGYILTGGEEKPTVALHVYGDLENPEVDHTAFKEVVTYPLNVLKRTVLLPAHLVEQSQKYE